MALAVFGGIQKQQQLITAVAYRKITKQLTDPDATIKLRCQWRLVVDTISKGNAI
jgi:hypothetical protein